MMETKFNRGTTLQQMHDELVYNNCNEITRIINRDGVFSVEYNTPSSFLLEEKEE